MAEDDEAARKERADKLREQISRYKKKGAAGGEEESPEPDSPQPGSGTAKSPRDFVHERMRELGEEEKEK